MEKFRLLTADEIECRVKKVSEKGAVILLYKTARTDMDLLDESVGAENWESDYREIKGNLFAGIGISTERGVVWKWDCGIESREDSEGNQKKGEASDAFKRAGFKWGIGRELYSAPFVFFPASDMNISSGKTFDTFTINNIEYDDKRRIVCLSILNNKTKKIWSWNSKSITKTEKKPFEKPASKPNPTRAKKDTITVDQAKQLQTLVREKWGVEDAEEKFTMLTGYNKFMLVKSAEYDSIVEKITKAK